MNWGCLVDVELPLPSLQGQTREKRFIRDLLTFSVRLKLQHHLIVKRTSLQHESGRPDHMAFYLSSAAAPGGRGAHHHLKSELWLSSASCVTLGN